MKISDHSLNNKWLKPGEEYSLRYKPQTEKPEGLCLPKNCQNPRSIPALMQCQGFRNFVLTGLYLLKPLAINPDI
jgi:hypothetical protein